MIATDLKAKRGKCLALAAVLAMVFCAFAVALPAGDSVAESRTATATVLSDASDLSDEGGDYYVAKLDSVIDVTGAEDETYNIYLLDGASVTFSDLLTGTFNVYFANAVDSSKTTDNVTYMWDLKLVGVAGNTYMADAMDDDNKVADRIIVGSADEEPDEDSYYGVIVHNVDTVMAYCYAAGTDIGEVSLTDTGDGVLIINGSATINAAYVDDDGVEHIVQTIIATDILVADVTKPVKIEVTGDKVEELTMDAFTVSGGTAKDTTHTTGSITVAKNKYNITTEDMDGLAWVLNGYYADGAMSARAETGEADPANVIAVFGSVPNPGAALSHVGGVIFFNTTIEEAKVGSGSNIVTLSMTEGFVAVDDGSLSNLKSGTVVLINGTFTAPIAANIEADEEATTLVPYGATLTVNADAKLELNDDVVVRGTMNVYGKLSVIDGATESYVLTVEGTEAAGTASAEIAVLKAYSGSIDSKVSINDTGTATDVNTSLSPDNGGKKGSNAVLIIVVILIVLIVVIVAMKFKKNGKN